MASNPRRRLQTGLERHKLDLLSIPKSVMREKQFYHVSRITHHDEFVTSLGTN